MPRNDEQGQFVAFNGGVTAVGNPGARTFYVGASGWTAAPDGIAPSDSNNGTSPQTPYASIQTGLDACTAGRGDVVALLPGNYTVTAAITMSKDDVTLRSATPVGRRQRSPVIIVNATDVNTVEVNANNVTVEGIQFDDNVATATAATAVIAVNTASTGVDYTGTVIRNCYLDMLGSDSDRDGIALGLTADADDGAIQSLVEGCTILDPDNCGVIINVGSDYSVVRDCHIYDMVNLGLYGVEVLAAQCSIEDCDILVSDTAGPGACIHNGLAASLMTATGNNLHAWGADGTAILVIATATQRTADNFVTATATGNGIDYVGDNTTPSADAFAEAFYAADPGTAVLSQSTDDGADA